MLCAAGAAGRDADIGLIAWVGRIGIFGNSPIAGVLIFVGRVGAAIGETIESAVDSTVTLIFG